MISDTKSTRKPIGSITLALFFFGVLLQYLTLPTSCTSEDIVKNLSFLIVKAIGSN